MLCIPPPKGRSGELHHLGNGQNNPSAENTECELNSFWVFHSRKPRVVQQVDQLAKTHLTRLLFNLRLWLNVKASFRDWRVFVKSIISNKHNKQGT